jgi:hypothetical protein
LGDDISCQSDVADTARGVPEQASAADVTVGKGEVSGTVNGAFVVSDPVVAEAHPCS